MSQVETFSHYAASMEPDAPESIQAEAMPATRLVSSRNSYTVTHEGTAGGSVADTIRRDGVGYSVETIPGDPTSRTDVRVAERLGLVIRNDQGRYTDVRQDIREAVQADLQGTQQEAPPADPGAEVFAPNADAALQAVVDPLPQHTYEAALSKGMAFVVNEHGDLAGIGAHIARESRMEHEQGTAVAHVMLSHFETAGRKALESVGVVGKERQAHWLAEVRTQHRGEFAAAVQALVYGRDPSGIKALGQAFADRNPGPEVAALKAAGFEVARSGAGGWLARTGGGQWQPVSAILANLQG